MATQQFAQQDRQPPRGPVTSRPAPAEEPLKTGRVKWMDHAKGYGFIVPDDGGADVFLHKSVLFRCRVDRVQEGDAVRYRAEIGKKGKAATYVEKSAR